MKLEKSCSNCRMFGRIDIPHHLGCERLIDGEKACTDWKGKEIIKDCDTCLHGKRLSDAHNEEDGYYDIECVIADGDKCYLNGSFRSWKPKEGEPKPAQSAEQSPPVNGYKRGSAISSGSAADLPSGLAEIKERFGDLPFPEYKMTVHGLLGVAFDNVFREIAAWHEKEVANLPHCFRCDHKKCKGTQKMIDNIGRIVHEEHEEEVARLKSELQRAEKKAEECKHCERAYQAEQELKAANARVKELETPPTAKDEHDWFEFMAKDMAPIDRFNFLKQRVEEAKEEVRKELEGKK